MKRRTRQQEKAIFASLNCVSPLKAYHGTRAGDFGSFKSKFCRRNQVGFGISFTPDRSFAERYANDPLIGHKGSKPFVHVVDLDFKNPLDARRIVVEGSSEYALGLKLLGRKRLPPVEDEQGKRVLFMRVAIDASSPKRAEKIIRDAGYDAVIYDSVLTSSYGCPPGYGEVVAKAPTYVVFDNSQIRKLKDDVSPLRKSCSFDEVKTGEPILLRAFHGTSVHPDNLKAGFVVPESERNPFSEKLQKALGREGLLGSGVYFSDKKFEAEKYGSPVAVEVELKKPYVIGKGYWSDFKDLDIQKLRAEGYDSIICRGGKYGLYGGENYRQGVVFSPEQIKVVEGKFLTDELCSGARVKDKKTGRTGVVRNMRDVSNPDFLKYLEVRWNKNKNAPAETNPNVKDTEVELL